MPTRERDDEPITGTVRELYEAIARAIADTDLERQCDSCLGKGRHRSNHGLGWDRCRSCNGVGAIPTEFGEKVLSLMRHNFRPMLEDATDG